MDQRCEGVSPNLPCGPRLRRGWLAEDSGVPDPQSGRRGWAAQRVRSNRTLLCLHVSTVPLPNNTTFVGLDLGLNLGSTKELACCTICASQRGLIGSVPSKATLLPNAAGIHHPSLIRPLRKEHVGPFEFLLIAPGPLWLRLAQSAH